MLIGMPGHANPVDEPGVNTVRCPRHDHWLYRRQKIDAERGVRWSCGVEGCDYGYDANTKGDFYNKITSLAIRLWGYCDNYSQQEVDDAIAAVQRNTRLRKAPLEEKLFVLVQTQLEFLAKLESIELRQSLIRPKPASLGPIRPGERRRPYKVYTHSI